MKTKPIIDISYQTYQFYKDNVHGTIPEEYQTRLRIWRNEDGFFYTREEWIYPNKKGPSRVNKEKMSKNDIEMMAFNLDDRGAPELIDAMEKINWQYTWK